MTTKIIKKKIEAEVDDDLEKYLENSVVAFSILEEELTNSFTKPGEDWNLREMDSLWEYYEERIKNLVSTRSKLITKTEKERRNCIEKLFKASFCFDKRRAHTNNSKEAIEREFLQNCRIGEIRKGSEFFSYTTSQTDREYKLVNCSRCNKLSWLGINNGRLLTDLCLSCFRCKSAKKRTIKNNGYYMNGGGYIELQIHKSDPYFSMAKKKRERHEFAKLNKDSKDYSYVLEHRYIMAQHLGRCLESWEVVHHINGIKDDNRIENLELLQEPKEHLPSMAMQQRIKKLEKQLSAT